ncbi:hypothetical protein CEXT_723241 [Caerostris extrusa]|uniref:Uncharacterized protein n=1 Tax=Caerostris extrusa TaxID=172846 RepID=A0AAV4XKD5_CAEEX|nr:hypothetical protein CEXT_723241 [Caerostris extrusa]
MDRLRQDLFSPIRGSSIDEVDNHDKRRSGSISKFLKGPDAFKENFLKAGQSNAHSKSNKEKTSTEEIWFKKSDKPSRRKNENIKSKDVLSLSPFGNDDVFATSPSEDSAKHSKSSPNSESVTKNKNSLQKCGKSVNTNRRSYKTDKKSDKDISIDFVTVRDRSSQQKETKAGNSKTVTNVLPTHFEDMEKSHVKSAAPQVIVSDLDQTTKNYNLLKEGTKENFQIENKKDRPTIVSGSEKNIKKTDKLASTSKRNPLSQIQSGILEKLINDTIQYQFDGVRQQLHSQHFSLCKTMYSKLEEMEERHAAEKETMFKIIEVLLEENRQLRNAILACQ